MLISLANAPDEVRAAGAGGHSRRHGRRAAGRCDDPAHGGRARLDVTQVYGLTETAPFITVCEPRPEHESLPLEQRCVIKARQGVELVTSGDLRVLDEAGNEVPHDGRPLGEICVRGNVVMEGYYDDPKATAEAMRGGWFHSGDAAVVHPDGYVEIRDRFKDVIISGGENISSVEVEGTLMRHPAVQEVGVVGVKHEKWGEAPHAFVVLKPGASATDRGADRVRARAAGALQGAARGRRS